MKILFGIDEDLNLGWIEGLIAVVRFSFLVDVMGLGIWMVALEVGKISVYTLPEEGLQSIFFRMLAFLLGVFFFSFLFLCWHLSNDSPPSKHTPSIPHLSIPQDSFPRQSPAS